MLGIEPHLFFAVRKRPFLATFVTLLQNCPAQQWQFLQSNTVSPGQR
jgi:hypothetical protein